MSGESPTSRPDPSRPAPRATARSQPDAVPASDEVWLSTREVSERLKIPLKTLASWASAGRGPRFARMGRYRRYRVTDLIAWEEQQLANGGGSSAGST
ncbi:helix-turn-helix domain-containing protein [Nocardia sp. NBC_00881]|uniref:helix-turn-helix domain-containing protein n=1 Tax=Nocardia sp. NBC_00881 TaxID=2975995 RepID=UPI003870C07F|nr:helix-turn-helix domain-containing protein [Nocardia sp. NBC_00881]